MQHGNGNTPRVCRAAIRVDAVRWSSSAGPCGFQNSKYWSIAICTEWLECRYNTILMKLSYSKTSIFNPRIYIDLTSLHYLRTNDQGAGKQLPVISGEHLKVTCQVLHHPYWSHDQLVQLFIQPLFELKRFDRIIRAGVGAGETLVPWSDLRD